MDPADIQAAPPKSGMCLEKFWEGLRDSAPEGPLRCAICGDTEYGDTTPDGKTDIEKELRNARKGRRQRFLGRKSDICAFTTGGLYTGCACETKYHVVACNVCAAASLPSLNIGVQNTIKAMDDAFAEEVKHAEHKWWGACVSGCSKSVCNIWKKISDAESECERKRVMSACSKKQLLEAEQLRRGREREKDLAGKKPAV